MKSQLLSDTYSAAPLTARCATRVHTLNAYIGTCPHSGENMQNASSL